jgi:hypothetical protein
MTASSVSKVRFGSTAGEDNSRPMDAPVISKKNIAGTQGELGFGVRVLRSPPGIRINDIQTRGIWGGACWTLLSAISGQMVTPPSFPV